jgi:hypothetical protein
MSLWDYSDIIKSDDKNLGSICYTPNLPITLLSTTILSNENFRPDKISYRLYGNPMLSWILDDANSFYHMKEYYANRIIKYPSKEALDIMRINYSYTSFEEQNY